MSSRVKGFAIIISITTLVCLGIKYLLPLLVPFLAAFFIVLIIHPLVDKIHKKIHLNKGIITGGLILLVVGILAVLLWFAFSKIFEQIRLVYENIELYKNILREFLNGFCSSFEGILGIQAEFIKEFLMRNLDTFIMRVEQNSIPKMMENSINYLIVFIQVFGVGIIIFISIILLTKDFDHIKKFHQKFFYYKGLRTFGIEAVRVAKSYMKSQLMIMSVITIICIVGLFLLRNPYALAAGIFIGVFDALPVFGTGFIFVPLMGYHLLQGNYIYAAAYLTLYIVCSMVREFLEPKLIGDKLGMPSVMVLVSVYIGLKLFGLTGIFTGPLGYLLIKEFTVRIFQHLEITFE